MHSNDLHWDRACPCPLHPPARHAETATYLRRRREGIRRNFHCHADLRGLGKREALARPKRVRVRGVGHMVYALPAAAYQPRPLGRLKLRLGHPTLNNLSLTRTGVCVTSTGVVDQDPTSGDEVDVLEGDFDVVDGVEAGARRD